MRIILGRIFQACRYLNLEVPSIINRSLGHYENCRLALNVLRDEAELITLRRNGTLWTCYAWDKYITEHLFVNGGYHIAEIQSVLSWMEYHQRLAKGKNVIINVGANIGTTSIPFAQLTACRVLAIEPITDNFKLLQQNVHQNKLEERVTCVQAAIDIHPGVVQMALPQSNCGGAVIKQTGTKLEFADADCVKGTIEVPADTLIHILETQKIAPDQVAFVWSDTEGSEFRVIATGEQFWLAGVPLYIEVFPEALRLQNGLEIFIRLVNKFFERFIESSDLARDGIKAQCRPISEMERLVDRLCENYKKGGIYISDVLLLPA